MEITASQKQIGNITVREGSVCWCGEGRLHHWRNTWEGHRPTKKIEFQAQDYRMLFVFHTLSQHQQGFNMRWITAERAAAHRLPERESPRQKGRQAEVTGGILRLQHL